MYMVKRDVCVAMVGSFLACLETLRDMAAVDQALGLAFKLPPEGNYYRAGKARNILAEKNIIRDLPKMDKHGIWGWQGWHILEVNYKQQAEYSDHCHQCGGDLTGEDFLDHVNRCHMCATNSKRKPS